MDKVIITDINMKFSSMVIFMVKWAVAAIPAAIILMLSSLMVWGIIVGIVEAW